MYKILKLFQYISTTFVTTVLLLVTGNYLLWFAHIAARDFYSGPDPRASSPVYENFKGKEKLWEEFHSIEMRFSPYHYWRTKKYLLKTKFYL